MHLQFFLQHNIWQVDLPLRPEFLYNGSRPLPGWRQGLRQTPSRELQRWQVRTRRSGDSPIPPTPPFFSSSPHGQTEWEDRFDFLFDEFIEIGDVVAGQEGEIDHLLISHR